MAMAWLDPQAVLVGMNSMRISPFSTAQHWGHASFGIWRRGLAVKTVATPHGAKNRCRNGRSYKVILSKKVPPICWPIWFIFRTSSQPNPHSVHQKKRSPQSYSIPRSEIEWFDVIHTSRIFFLTFPILVPLLFRNIIPSLHHPNSAHYWLFFPSANHSMDCGKYGEFPKKKRGIPVFHHRFQDVTAVWCWMMTGGIPRLGNLGELWIIFTRIFTTFIQSIDP